MLSVKECKYCKVTQPLANFYRNKAYKGGHIPKCKSCRAEDFQKNKHILGPKRIEKYYRNQDKNQEYSRKWYAENKERALAACSSWAQRNKDKVCGYSKKVRKLHPERKNYYTQLYRTRKLGATPAWLSEWDLFVIQEYYYKAKRLEALTGIKWHVDHIHPLRGKHLCGLHVPWNLQLLPAELNIAKGNKLCL